LNSPLHDFFLDEDLVRQIRSGVDTVIVDFTKIIDYDEEFAEKFLKEPLTEVKYLCGGASSYAGRDVNVHIINIPAVEMAITRVCSKDLYRLVQVRGTVILRTRKDSRPRVLVYKCPCGAHIRVEQTEQWRISPEICLNCEGRKGFTKIYERTEFDDFQWIEIQELTENTPNTKTPEKIRVLLKNDLVDQCIPGETVIITGVPRVLEKAPNTLQLEMKLYVEALGMMNDTEKQITNLTPKDIEQVQHIMNQPDYLDNIIESYAPTIYGMEYVKESLAYQQCEGVTKTISGKRKRGQFHVLMAGPPGVGKTELGKYSVRYHVKGREATGRGASGVGLTASVVQEDGEWMLKAGAMVLADNGLLFVDEVEKMSKDDSGAMHPAMEQQEIPVNKAGINATVKTRCSVLAACNPLTGVWNDYKNLVGNLHEGNKGLPLTFLDRFALKFVVKMPTDVEEERKVAEHIALVNTRPEDIQPPYTTDMLRKIFSYARTIRPTISKELAEKMTEFYLRLFKASTMQNVQIISRRQIEDLFRITESSAKLHGREEAVEADMERALAMVSESLKECYMDMDTGVVDQTKAFYDEPKSKGAKMKEVPELVKRLSSRNIDTTKISMIELVEYASKRWRTLKHEAREIIDLAKKEGLVYYPTPYDVAVS